MYSAVISTTSSKRHGFNSTPAATAGVISEVLFAAEIVRCHFNGIF
jgi:hypothetical protein